MSSSPASPLPAEVTAAMDPNALQNSSEKEEAVDQKFLDLHSRQIGTYGLETMAKVVALRVVIAGVNGTAVEAAKNLALAGVHSITLVDSTVASIPDLGVNFCYNEATIMKHTSATRAELSASLLSELNPHVRIRHAKELTEEMVAQCHVLILTNAYPTFSKSVACHWNDVCRAKTTPKHRISFLMIVTAGVMGAAFVDHGDNFVVTDPDGRPEQQKLIQDCHNRVDKKGRKYTSICFMTPEGMTPGSLASITKVRFSSVADVVDKDGRSLNDAGLFDAISSPADNGTMIRLYPSLEERGFNGLPKGGFLHEPKRHETRHYVPLRQALQTPKGRLCEYCPFSECVIVDTFMFVASYLEYLDKHEGRKPPLHSADVAAEFGELASKLQADGKAALEQFEKTYKAPPPPPEDPEFPITVPSAEPRPLFPENMDLDLIKKAAVVASAELQPWGAFWGAIAAQETLKTTGKFSPLGQFLTMHCATVLPNVDYTTAGKEYAPTGSRDDHLVSLFGRTFATRLANLKLFMVGCGALGCEDMKNFALNGICCGENGLLTVTDNDRIEVSNLSRQFLFREDNVGQPKSVAAAARAKTMNSSIKVNALTDFVGANTYQAFPDKFWMGLDGVVNALDNIPARMFVDSRCVLYKKPLLEAGTMGTGGNVDIIIPGKTNSYADGGNADETGGIPMCTLRNFPYIFAHAIEWARAQFDDLFVFPIQQLQLLLDSPQAFSDKMHTELNGAGGTRMTILDKHIHAFEQILNTLQTLNTKPTMSDCVRLAWRDLHILFRDSIQNLILTFPRDAKKKNGELFWSGHHRFPTPIDGSDIENNTFVMEYMIAATNLYASMFGIHGDKHPPKLNDPKHRWKAEYRTTDFILGEIKKQKLAVPEFVRAKVADLDEETSAEAGNNNAGESESEEALMSKHESLLSSVVATADKAPKCAAPLDFEKDDDDNFHIDFVAAAANLRALNYEIPTEDRMKVKMVAGKIIPAVATSTSAVTGLALIEFLKALLEKPLEDLRCGNMDIGTNTFSFFEPDPPKRTRTGVTKTYDPETDYTFRKKTVAVPEGFTKYDSITIDVTSAMTCGEFVKALLDRVCSIKEGEYDVDALGVGKGTIWTGAKHPNNDKPLLAVIEAQFTAENGGKPLEPPFWTNRLLFDGLTTMISVEDDDDVDDVELLTPAVVLQLV